MTQFMFEGRKVRIFDKDGETYVEVEERLATGQVVLRQAPIDQCKELTGVPIILHTRLQAELKEDPEAFRERYGHVYERRAREIKG